MERGFWFFKKKTKKFLILDIGTLATKAILFEKKEKETNILGAFQEYFDEFSIFDSQDFSSDLLKKVIVKIIGKVKREIDQKLEGIFLSLPANILRLGLVFPKIFRKNPKEKIKKREEEELKKVILEMAKKEIFRELEREGEVLAKEIHFLSLKILEMKIDGYFVSRLQGYTGQNLETRVLATFLTKSSLDYYSKIFQNFNLPILNIGHYSQVLNRIFDKKDALFFDIGGEKTQIFLVRNGLLEKIETLDLAGNFFSQFLSEDLGLNRRDGRILKERYAKKELSQESMLKIREILTPALQEWFLALKTKLKRIGGIFSPEIFLFGGESLLFDLKEILEKGDWEDLVFFNKIEVKVLKPKDLKDFSDLPEKINQSYYTPAFLFLLANLSKDYDQKGF